MAFTQDLFSSRRNYGDGQTRVGENGRLWYDSISNTFRVSDGATPGGVVVGNGINSYTLPAATALSLGGVRIGNNIDIEDDGTI